MLQVLLCIGLPLYLLLRLLYPQLHSSRRQLQQFGLQVQFKSYPMQHNVCAEEIRDLGDWMDRRFQAG